MSRNHCADAEGPQGPDAGVTPELALLEVVLVGVLIRDACHCLLLAHGVTPRMVVVRRGREGPADYTPRVCRRRNLYRPRSRTARRAPRGGSGRRRAQVWLSAAGGETHALPQAGE